MLLKNLKVYIVDLLGLVQTGCQVTNGEDELLSHDQREYSEKSEINDWFRLIF